MFGFLVANSKTLAKQDKETYKSYYCGLCHCLKENYGTFSTSFLSYDLTFINILLSSYQKEKDTINEENCVLHPLKKHQYRINSYSKYCTDVNLLMTYYKLIDDVNDDKNHKAEKTALKLKSIIDQIEKNNSSLATNIKSNLDNISQIEKDNILNPDYNCDYFGRIMAKICDPNNDDDNLNKFGYHLGRFIYLMDAVVDLKKDLKKQRYNPLVQYSSDKFEEMLMMIMEEVNTYYQKLNIENNKDILDNIIYDGIWQQFRIQQRRKK